MAFDVKPEMATCATSLAGDLCGNSALDFRCDRPFWVLLVDGDVASWNISVEFALKVEGTAVVARA